MAPGTILGCSPGPKEETHSTPGSDLETLLTSPTEVWSLQTEMLPSEQGLEPGYGQTL